MEFCRRAICRDGRCFCSMDLAESTVWSLLPVWKALCCKNSPSQCSPLQPGQTSPYSSTKVCAEQLLFRVTSARREGPGTEVEFDLVVPVGVGAHPYLIARMIFKEVIKGGCVQRSVLFMTHMVGALTVFPACFHFLLSHSATAGGQPARPWAEDVPATAQPAPDCTVPLLSLAAQPFILEHFSSVPDPTSEHTLIVLHNELTFLLSVWTYTCVRESSHTWASQLCPHSQCL